MDKNKLFIVLAEPNRRKILDLLRTQERSVGELVEILHLSQPGISKHLRILREANLVNVKKEGQSHIYQLDAEPLREIHNWFEPYQHFWSDKLDSLEKHLETEDRLINTKKRMNK
ncbi:transcriptional repressor SdpR [Oxobacter pfennigii]|uniref:Transcriptional repressor SdpR n=1 Tax=Oxobacter pfennigii TaxID=36849 RepID=A0A0P8W6B8_9CLOT|nr:metalloregulator ArsR/SmtB family transcription factor [Oxobacter pfennigii]KPU43541.1 transcriptional repressor SdpR [Oxobacter pfennigii]